MAAKINWDTMGIVTSIACAIHCALLPVLVTSLPLMGIDIIHNAFFEWTMIIIAFVIGIYALVHGYVKHHQNKMPLMLFLAGFILMLLKQVFHQYEFLFLIPAVPLIIGAHYYNYTLCHKSKCSSPHHKH